MIITSPDNFNIEQLNDTFLWKYIDIYKFIDFLINKELYFTRLDQFDDKLEGLPIKVLLKMFYSKNIAPITKETVDKNLGNEEYLNKNIELYNSYRNEDEFKIIINEIQKCQFASCWFIGNKESHSMWKIYSKKDGIVLKFKAKPLIAKIINYAENYPFLVFPIMYYGKVNYKNIWPIDLEENYNDVEFPGLVKDSSYVSENEFRFVAISDKKELGKHKCFKLKIEDTFTDNDLGMEIITNPFIEDYQYNSLKAVIEKFNIYDKLKKSEMIIKKSF